MKQSWPVRVLWSLFLGAAVASAAGLVGCSSMGSSKPGSEQDDGRWLPASPILRQQIDDEAERLPWRHGVERLEAIRWFASIGEPAYPQLLELATDPRDHVAASALAALGATGDKRLVEPLKIIPWAEERYQGDLGLEHARTLLRLGDWSEIPILLAGLRDPRLYTRSLCAKELFDATGESFAFDPRASEDERERAIARWEGWWLARTGEGLLDERRR